MHCAMELTASAKEAAFVADAVNMFEQREGILALVLFFAESCLHTVKHHAPSVYVSMFLTANSSDGKKTLFRMFRPAQCATIVSKFDLGFSSCYSVRHAVYPEG